MEGYGYMYPPGFQTMRPPDMQYLDQGDGYGEYYGMGPVTEDLGKRYVDAIDVFYVVINLREKKTQQVLTEVGDR